MQELYDQIHESVANEARYASNRWNGLLEADDIEQMLWEWILERPSAQAYLKAAEPAQLKAALSTKADHLCSQERIDYDRFTGNFNYTPADVRRILDRVSDFAEPTEFDDEKLDLEMGMDRLIETHPQYHEVIVKRFFLDEQLEGHAEYVRSERAVDKLASLMNRKRSEREADRTEGPGTKPKISIHHDMYESESRGATFEGILPGYTTAY